MKDLTERQQSIVDLIVQGLSSKEIGLKLGLSPRTIETHRDVIYKKMGVRNGHGLLCKVLASFA